MHGHGLRGRRLQAYQRRHQRLPRGNVSQRRLLYGMLEREQLPAGEHAGIVWVGRGPVCGVLGEQALRRIASHLFMPSVPA